jgi:hypothetical protein
MVRGKYLRRLITLPALMISWIINCGESKALVPLLLELSAKSGVSIGTRGESKSLVPLLLELWAKSIVSVGTAKVVTDQWSSFLGSVLIALGTISTTAAQDFHFRLPNE